MFKLALLLCFIAIITLLCHVFVEVMLFWRVLSLDLVCLLSHTTDFLQTIFLLFQYKRLLGFIWVCLMLLSKLKEQPIWSDIICSSETPALSTCLSLHVSFSLSLRWDVVRGGNQSPDPHAGWTAFHRSAGIRSGSRLPDVRLLPRTAGTKWLFFLSISQLLDSSQSAQAADCVSLLF